MGCSASKNQTCSNEKHLPPFLCGSSLTRSSTKGSGGSPSCNSLKPGSRTTSTVEGQDIASQRAKSCQRLKPVREEDFLSRSPNEKARQKACQYTGGLSMSESGPKKYASSTKCASLGSAHEIKARAVVSPFGVGDSNENNIAMSKLQGNESLCHDSRASSFRVSEWMDGLTGLRLLLSPAATPSRSFASSARSGMLRKALSSSSSQYASNQSTDNVIGANMQANQTRLVNKQASQAIKAIPSQLEEVGDSEETGSPLFDPSILATFEKAIEASSNDNWPSSDATSSGCSTVGFCSLSDTSSDADSLYSHKESVSGHRKQHVLARQMLIENNLCEGGGDDFCYQSNVVPKKKPSSKIIPLHRDLWVKNEYLQGFDMKCPQGCEDKIVLYFTSLRGIRKTYEDCCNVRLILKGFGVQVDERDVWMHSSFRQELTRLVGSVLVVPRLFVRGRYIGGVDDVIRLHEEGILGYLLDGLPADLKSKCATCAGIRFIPCTACSGSCKLISLGEVSQCPDCNENGLMMCPSCY